MNTNLTNLTNLPNLRAIYKKSCELYRFTGEDYAFANPGIYHYTIDTMYIKYVRIINGCYRSDPYNKTVMQLGINKITANDKSYFKVSTNLCNYIERRLDILRKTSITQVILEYESINDFQTILL